MSDKKPPSVPPTGIEDELFAALKGLLDELQRLDSRSALRPPADPPREEASVKDQRWMAVGTWISLPDDGILRNRRVNVFGESIARELAELHNRSLPLPTTDAGGGEANRKGVMTKEDYEQIAEAIDQFIVGNDPEMEAIWQPFIDKLRAEPSTTMEAWRPIETAPKDGTTIIVFKHTPPCWNIIGTAFWFGGENDSVCGWMSYGIPRHSMEASTLGLAHPTHWQPLPAPPAPSVTETTP